MAAESCVHVTVPARGGVYLFVRDGKVTGVVASGTGTAERSGIALERYIGMPIDAAKALAHVGLKKRKAK